MPVFATVDIGTNSMKLLVGSVDASPQSSLEPRIRVCAEDLVVTRLGEGLAETGRLSEAAIERNLMQLDRMVEQARRLDARQIAVVGTMALREAANAEDFIERARADCGVEVEIISGEEEARLSFLGALSGLTNPASRVCVFDTGGGSTEFILGENRSLKAHFSINLGVRGPTERHLQHDPPLPVELAALRREVADQLDAVAGRWVECRGIEASRESPEGTRLVGLGGTVTTLAAVQQGLTRYDSERIRGTVLDRSEIERQILLYAGLPRSQRQEIDGLEPERADVILAGACIVAGILESMDQRELEVNDRGLRHGLFIDRFVAGFPGRPGH